MKNKINQKGFSLAEILMSLGILSIGMLLIAAVFPAGIHFTTIATERTIASSVADEAFAKIKMYCSDPNVKSELGMLDFELEVFPQVQSSFIIDFNEVEFSYPSDDSVNVNRRMYFWSALWRRFPSVLDPTGSSIQVTVFVSRSAGAPSQYYKSDEVTQPIGIVNYPRPVVVQAERVPSAQSELRIKDRSFTDKFDERTFINPASTIVDAATGRIYRVLDRRADRTDTIVLDRLWYGDPTSEVWVIPPPVGGGRYPCIAVYQRVIRF